VTEAHRRLARNIRRLAKAKKLALTHLADRAAVSRAELFNVLKGDRSPTLRWIEAIAKALDADIADLLQPLSTR
jgi:transcriptional regulator with XRE-family HTH domain